MVETNENTTPSAKPVLPQNNRVSLPREWPYRLLGNALILAFIFLVAFVTITIRTNLVSKQMAGLTQEFYTFTTKIGFTLDDIIIEGREKTSRQDILNILNLRRGDNIFNIDIHALKQKIETLPWVKTATIKRSYYPNILLISITEREVASIWQINERFHPIDTEGNVISADFKPTRPILLIVGEGAPENINELLDIIKKDNDLYQRVKVANYISGRRWNLILDDIKTGITIKLPEENIEAAWKKLIKLDKTKGILKRKLTNIDLRLEDKVIVKIEKMTKEERQKLKAAKEHST